MKKKAIILQHNGDELGSQLWNYVSIYAYSLSRGYACVNPSFFEYNHYFKHLKIGNPFISFFFSFLFAQSKHHRSTDLYIKILRFFYKIYVYLIRKTQVKRLYAIGRNVKYGIQYLPPTQESRKINQLEKKGTIYFDGHLFRNPFGLDQYRNEIVNFFAPSDSIQKSVRTKLVSLRNKYNHVVGVHVRQSDFREFKRGKYFVDQGHMRHYIDEFIDIHKINSKKTVFYIASDSDIDEKFFKGLNYELGDINPAIDLFTLSGCDVILGPDSRFSSFASYYGNIPHIVCSRSEIDWKFYRDKATFFNNKYWKVTKY
jgi:hypothetical protein